MTFKHKNPDTGSEEIYTYDVDVLPNPGKTIKDIQAHSDPTLQDDKVVLTNKDISVRTKKTLSQYISDKSKGKSSVGGANHPSAFTLDANSVTIDTNDANGYPKAIDELNDNHSKYIDNTYKLDHEAMLRTVSDDYVYAKDQNNFSVTKGVVPENQRKNRNQEVIPDGHQLLKNDKNVSNIGDRYVSRSVLRHNRFTSDNKQTDDVTITYGGAQPGQNNLVNAQTITPGRLANIGAILSLRGSNEWGSNDPFRNPNSGGTEAKAAMPSLEQLGTQRINVANFEVKNIIDQLTSDEDSLELDVSSQSWGALNNIYDQFSGMSAIGMATLSIALTASVMALATSFAFLASLPSSPNAVKQDSYGRLPLGANTAYPNSGTSIIPPKIDINELLGLRRTTSPLNDAINAGIAVFFGLDIGSNKLNLLKSLSTTVSKAFDAPGFYVVVARGMLRSGVVMADVLKSAFSGNIVSGVKQMMGMFDTIRRSKFIATINMFATIGDLSLQKDSSPFVLKSPNEEHPDRDSVIDALDSSTAQTVQMNRLNNSLRIAWGSHRAHAMYLESPFTTFLSKYAFGNTVGSISSATQQFTDMHGNDKRIKVKSISESRISTDEREEFEKNLDAEYVPFYFHDLRTNEIIAFHAFLSALTDDYTPNWENVEGVGRIDPVRIYKNTHRKLTMSFYVVSTSKQDFEMMWIKLNKLTTLIYPQYTKGRTIYDGETIDSSENVLTQPFSQIVGASPLIRLRLGDLFKSNYTKFSLAKLFGIGSDGFKLGKDTDFSKITKSLENDENVQKLNNKVKSEFINYINNQLTPPNNYKFTLTDGALCSYADPTKSSVTLKIPFSKTTGYADSFHVGKTPRGLLITPNIIECTVVGYCGTGPVVKIEFAKNADKTTIEQINVASRFVSDIDGPYKIIGGTYVVNPDSLTFTDKTQKIIYDKYATEIMGELGIQAFDKISDFMSRNKNALVRSYRESGGKGLAGTIDSLNFDWYDKIPWEIDRGMTAPIMCKVTLSYTPIHDISPGLDHNGNNRAPIYRVGSAYGLALEDKA